MQVYKIYCTLPNKSAMRNKVQKKKKPQKTNHGGAWGGGVMNWEIGIDMYTLVCIK